MKPIAATKNSISTNETPHQNRLVVKGFDHNTDWGIRIYNPTRNAVSFAWNVDADHTIQHIEQELQGFYSALPNDKSLGLTFYGQHEKHSAAIIQHIQELEQDQEKPLPSSAVNLEVINEQSLENFSVTSTGPLTPCSMPAQKTASSGRY